VREATEEIDHLRYIIQDQQKIMESHHLLAGRNDVRSSASQQAHTASASAGGKSVVVTAAEVGGNVSHVCMDCGRVADIIEGVNDSSRAARENVILREKLAKRKAQVHELQRLLRIQVAGTSSAGGGGYLSGSVAGMLV
jgi:hypothetical protein